MDKQLSSIQNEEEDTSLIPLLKVEPDSLVETSIVPDLQGNEPGEEMIMVDPSLVTGRSVETISATVPINLILQDGSVLQLNANVANGDVDLQTLQNLVSAQLLSQQGQQSDLQDIKSEFLPVNGLVTNVVETTSPQTSQSLASPQSVGQNKESSLATFHVEKKHRGGWPKGKKRKPEKIVNSPKPPTTAYGFFTQARRLSLREENPSLTFAEMVKIMGNEWSCLGKDDKQKYIDQASDDKKRYIRDLEVYQESAEYQDFVRKNKARGKDGSSFDTLSNLGQKDTDSILYCEVCDFYFTNQHNRKEHFMGQRHLKNISKLYEEDLLKKRKQEEEELNDCLSSPVVTVEITQAPDASVNGDVTREPLDTDQFITDFIKRNQEREDELLHLQERVQSLQAENEALQMRYAELKEMELLYNNEMATLKTYGAALSAQIDGLNMVPNLFQALKL